MAVRLIACRNRVSEAKQVIPDRALAYGMFPDWEPIDPADAAYVDALKPPPAEPETPESPAAPEPAVEPAAAPEPRRRRAASGHDNEKE
jgi:hypothetical protein